MLSSLWLSSFSCIERLLQQGWASTWLGASLLLFASHYFFSSDRTVDFFINGQWTHSIWTERKSRLWQWTQSLGLLAPNRWKRPCLPCRVRHPPRDAPGTLIIQNAHCTVCLPQLKLCSWRLMDGLSSELVCLENNCTWIHKVSSVILSMLAWKKD